jgi:hypothetical protein
MKFDKPEIVLNVLAPYGCVKIQICDQSCVPLSGFTYEDCLPVTGDHLRATVRWKENNSLAELFKKQEWVKLQISLENAELFSLGDDISIANMPLEPDLVDYSVF